MRYLWTALIVFLMTAGAARAQQNFDWCGYALIENLPLLDNQLAALAAITPQKSAGVNPYELFQYRFSLDHSQVIVEGCWTAFPERDLIVSLLAQTVPVSQTLIDETAAIYSSSAQLSAQPIGAAQLEQPLSPITDLEPQQPLLLPTPSIVDATNAARLYVDAELTYSIFAPDGTHMDSELAARAYIAANDTDWDPPDA